MGWLQQPWEMQLHQVIRLHLQQVMGLQLREQLHTQSVALVLQRNFDFHQRTRQILLPPPVKR